MATRMTGLISGLDTDTLISQLVSARRSKVTKKSGDQTKLSWKQEIWKDLNKELKSLQSTAASMRFSTAYQKKTTQASNPNKVSVLTNGTATNSVQSLTVTQLAKSGYLTGGKVTTTDKSSATALTKLSDLGYAGGDGTLTITTGGKTTNVSVTADSTISDVLSALKDKGLNASFDEKNQRLFVSSKESGALADFSITAADGNGKSALAALGIEAYDKSTIDTYKALKNYTSDDVTADALSRAQAAAKSYVTTQSLYDEAVATKTELEGKGLKSVAEYDTSIEDYNTQIAALEAEIEAMDPEADKSAKEAELEQLKKDAEAEAANRADAQKLATAIENETTYGNKLTELSGQFTGTAVYDDNGKLTGYDNVEASAALSSEVAKEYSDRAAYAVTMLSAYENGTLSSAATKIAGQDAIINLNGAEFTNSNNTFEINGLTITAMATTEKGEEITLTTTDDTSGIYDMIKKFFKSYNSIINKLDELYNAASSKSYNPLTDEEKSALSDNEVEKYEKKIKDGLLRHDETIGNISNGLTTIMSGGIKVGDTTMYLSDFGIGTLDYFLSGDNEKHALHINGDADDENTSGYEDKLMKMITTDPDTVVDFFTSLSKSIYSKMSDLSAKVVGTRSYGSFYDDTKMDTDYKNYTTKIKEMEDKVNDYEDRLYKKFANMETALAKLQSNSSAVTGLLGNSN